MLRGANSLLRSGFRPVPQTLRRPALVRTQFNEPGGFGGAGGQQPPPRNPGGPEAIKRNWLYIGGAFLALGAGYSWISRHPDEARQARDQSLSEMSGRKKTEMAGFRHD